MLEDVDVLPLALRILHLQAHVLQRFLPQLTGKLLLLLAGHPLQSAQVHRPEIDAALIAMQEIVGQLVD